MYKLKNNQLEIHENPLTIPEGLMTNPTEDILIKNGYKPLEENKLEYDEKSQYLDIIGYTENEHVIIVNYCVMDIPI